MRKTNKIQGETKMKNFNFESYLQRTEKTVHLLGYGRADAKMGNEFKIGEKMLWNYGSKSLITGILKETKSFITFILLCSDGIKYERRIKKDRLIAIGK